MSELFSDRYGWLVASPVCPIVYQDDDPDAPDYNDGIWEASGNGDNVIDLNDHQAADNARGRQGNDALYGNGNGNRLQGDEGGDWIEGRIGRDILAGGAGDDWLFGGDGTNLTQDGDDCIDGGADRDWIDGENGDDLLTGGAGIDVLAGGAGADAMFGDDGDFGLGGDGDDTDGDAADWMSGGDGGDVMHGEGGDDVMWGGAGDDTTYGGTGHDRIHGGTGRDRMAGGAGDDLLLGGAGDDEMFGNLRQGQVDDLDFGSDNWLDMLGEASGGHDVMAGGAGDDIMDGGAGRDWMAGESGQDLMFGGRGSDMMDGGADRDVLQGDAGVDRIRGGSDNDVIEGGAQGDWLYGDFGRDAPFGWHVRFGAMADDANGQTYGGQIFDQLPIGWVELPVPALEVEKDRGEEGADLIRGGGGHDRIFGEGGNDRLFGDSGDDTIEGGDGRDSVVGNWGDDVLYGGRGDDFVYGRQDDDRLFGEDGDDVLKGGEGQDSLTGGMGTDRLHGEEGCDVLEGGEGRDIMDGGAADDLLLGGLDSDIMEGGSGADTLIGEEGRDDLSGGTGDDILLGGRHGDWLRGGGGNDRLYGQEGVDFQRGGAGDDVLHGGGANDHLFGDGGNDFLVGGAGNDMLVGGEGKDVFVFDVIWDGQTVVADFGHDILRDLDIDEDLDVLGFRVTAVGGAAGASGAAAFAALEAAATVTDDGWHTTISVGDSSLRLHNVSGGTTPFTSLGQDAVPIGGIGLNAISTGDAGYYEVVNVVAVTPGLTLATDEDTPVTVDLASVPALAGLAHIEIVQAPDAGTARIDGGMLVLDPAGDFESLAAGEVRRVLVDLFATSAHVPGTCPDGRRTDLSVLVEITGLNDAPVFGENETVFAIAEREDGAADENVAQTTLSGALAFSDADLSDTHTASVVPQATGYRGSFALVGTPTTAPDTVNGTQGWDFTVADADLDTLAEGETRVQRYDVTIDDVQGGTATRTVEVTLTGRNDAPEAADDDNSDDPVIEAGTTGPGDATAEGNVLSNDSDVDLLDTLSVSGVAAGDLTADPGTLAGGTGIAVTGAYGSLTVQADGEWIYTLDDSNVDVDALEDGDVAADVFTYVTDDGNGGQDRATLTISVSGTSDGATPTVDPVINEFVFDHRGEDSFAFIEVLGQPDADYAGFWLLEIEGDGSGAGTVDAAIEIGATDANGYFLADEDVENGTVSLLLVEGFTGAVGDDLDTNDDGVIDVAPWARILDSVAVSDGDTGDLTYGGLSLAPGYDGVSFDVGGASRIPNGTDTDSPADWVRNDFDGAGIPALGPGTLVPGEALNTPGRDNAVGDPATAITPISAIQGSGRVSPLAGQSVTVEAIVVGDFQDGGAGANGDLNGFFLQEEDADTDTDPRTSEGIFVFDGTGPAVDVLPGDRVRVTGTVAEFFGETQIGSITAVEILDRGNALPTAAEIAFPVAGVLANSDGALIADLEAYEGMLVTVPQQMTISDLFTLGRFGEIGLNAGGLTEAYTQANSPSVTGFGAFLEAQVRNTLVLDDGQTGQNPETVPFEIAGTPGNIPGQFDAADALSAGDTVEGLTGVVRFSRGSGGIGDETYRLNPTQTPAFADAVPRTDTAPDVGGTITVSAFNVLNFFTSLGDEGLTAGPLGAGVRGADSLAEFERQTDKLIAALAGIGADVFGLIELENEVGDQNGDGQFALGYIVDALNSALPGAAYDYVDPGTPYVGDDAIMVGMIYDSNAVRLASDTTVEILTDADLAALGADPGTPVFDGAGTSRAPLAATFEEIASGKTFTVAVNHFKSKGSVSPFGDNADIGDGTGNNDEARLQAAQALDAWLGSDPTGSGDGDVLVIGDLNAYAMEDPVAFLKSRGYEDQVARFLAADAFPFSFGFPVDLDAAPQAQTFGALDYLLANASIASQVTGAAQWQINSVEAAALGYDTTFKTAGQIEDLYATDPFRSSDHDPLVLGLDLGASDAPIA